MSDASVHILYIEDNPADFVLLEEILLEVANMDCLLENATTLSEGINRLAQAEFDIVLLDLSLPDSRGLDTFLSLKKKREDLPIIVMTGLDDENLAVRAVQEGAQDYLVKRQLDAELLSRAIRYSIEREKLVVKLRNALEQINTLKGFIPICASCKNVRDDKGYWHQVEEYVRAHSDAEFSHGICPDCAKKYYADYLKK